MNRIEKFVKLCNFTTDDVACEAGGLETQSILSSLTSLRLVALSLTAQIAFSIGELAVCAEFARCVISLSEGIQDGTELALMWALRGAAFILMGIHAKIAM